MTGGILLTGEATVTSVSGNTATVLIRKTSACSHDCSECSACTAPTFETTVSNPIGARCGDRVIIEAQSSHILAISLLVYILPVFLFIAAAVVCEAFSFGIFKTLSLFVCMIALWVVVIKITNKKIHTSNTIVDIIKD